MKIPVRRTPRTEAVGLTEGYAQAAPRLDFSPITDAVRQFAVDLEREQKGVEEFELNKRLISETNELLTDFETRKQSAPLGAANFTNQTLDDYEQRHTQILDEYWKKGYSQESLQNFALRLGSVRQNFGEQALRFQVDSVGKLADKELGEMTIGLSQFATATPDGYDSAVEELRDNIWKFPGLTEQQRNDIFEQNTAVIRQGAAKGLAMQNPGLIIELLDPQGFTAPKAVGSNPLDPQNGVGPSAYDLIKDFEGFRENTYWDVNHHRTGYGSDTITLADGTVREVKQGDRVSREDADRDLDRRLKELNAGIGERAGAGWAALPDGAKSAVMSVAYNYGEGHQRLRPLWEAVREGDPIKVASIIESFAGDNNGVNRDRRLKEAELARTSTVTTIDPGASSADQAPALETLVPTTGADGTPEAFDLATAETGNPILDDLNGSERLQVLAWARETQNKANTQIKAAMDVTIGNAVASISTGEYAGPQLTKEQVLQVYGPIEGEQKWSQYYGSLQTGQAVQRIKTLNPAEMERELQRLTPDPSKETYAQDLQLFEAAQRATQTILKEREDDPAAYVLRAFPEIAGAMEGAQTSEQRAAAYAQMNRAMERLGIPERERVFFTKDMIDRVGEEYKAAPAAEKFNIINSYINEMGGEIAGRTLGRAGGKEIAQDMVLYATLARTPNFQQTFMDVLRGKEVIAKDPARKPSFDVINREFAAGITTAINNLSPEVSRAINESAAALYVQRGGTTANGALADKKLYTTALKEVLGGSGMVDMTRGAVSDYTILPPSWNKATFENWIDGLQPGDLTKLNPYRKPPVDRTGRPLSLNDLRDDGVFVMLSPGTYGIKMASDGKYVMQSDGKVFRMRIIPRR